MERFSRLLTIECQDMFNAPSSYVAGRVGGVTSTALLHHGHLIRLQPSSSSTTITTDSIDAAYTSRPVFKAIIFSNHFTEPLGGIFSVGVSPVILNLMNQMPTRHEDITTASFV